MLKLPQDNNAQDNSDECQSDMTRRAHVARTGMLLCTALLTAALFMFVDRRTTPIILWDESRLAINAFEMFESGWSLTTTYGFEPDLWNTKPPLMIWLMAASIHAFGPSELALRLPSMMAALGTLGTVFWFTNRVTRSLRSATLALVLLATSVGFYGEHGARTADYDALLCFFTTSYFAMFYFAVHQRRPNWRLLLLAFVAVAAAAMTKTIAGIMPGAGVALYLVISGRLGRVLAWPRYAILMVLALLPLTAFYLAREASGPGFLSAVWFNDFAGRVQHNLGPAESKPWYHLQMVFYDGAFSAGPLALLAPLGLNDARGQSRRALLFALCCVAGQLAVVTFTATKLLQYVLPALPWLSIACAITIKERLPKFLGHAANSRPPALTLLLPTALIGAAVVNIGVRTVTMRYEVLLQRAWMPQANYGTLFATLHAHGVRRITVVDPGFRVNRIDADHPQLRFYTLLWQRRGMIIERRTSYRDVQVGVALASCDPATIRTLHPIGGHLLDVSGCLAMLPNRQRAAG
jgi:4-amino-4-deoxy-L-arabinose transferase-like glycosyltransferase